MATLDSEFEFAFEPSNWSSLSNQPMEPEPLMKKKRARARLDHMTPEEKQERRKEKNRQAAQTARDRKRSRLEKLEEENQRLREENMRLRSAILGNSRDQSVVDCSPSQAAAGGAVPVLHPNVQIIDSGVSDVDSKSATTTFMSSPMNSSYNYGTTLSSPEQNDDNLFNSVMERDNDVALVNEIQKLVSYVNGDNDDGVSIESAALINEPQQQVQDISTGLQLAGNSLGWTSVQLMLILMISRIHHRLSAKIDCCQRAPTRSNDEMDPNNCNLYDYLLHTRCADFRRAAETIISNKSNVRHQRLIALNFVQKYLYHTNINRKNHNSNNSSNNNNSNNNGPAQGTGCLVRARQ
uniref:X-box-binding protein 1 n=1 Tax=Aceria tosichella TaxID=561515 RepID=A0A6G1SKX6_9ACAR